MTAEAAQWCAREWAEMIMRRRRDAAGRWRYQRWPSNHPACLPEPPWLLPEDLSPKVQAAIMGAVLSDAFKPLPYDETVEEEMPPQRPPADPSFLTRGITDANDRDYPDWGRY